jgi:hypothetical protein
MLAAPGGANTYGESFFAALYEGELTDPDLFNYHHGAAGRVVGVRSAAAAERGTGRAVRRATWGGPWCRWAGCGRAECHCCWLLWLELNCCAAEGEGAGVMKPVFDYPVCSAANVGKVVAELIRLLQPPTPLDAQPEPDTPTADAATAAAVGPRASPLLRAVATLAQQFGVLSFAHAARIKEAITRAAEARLASACPGLPEAERVRTARAWQAFTFACAAMLCPHLLVRASERASSHGVCHATIRNLRAGWCRCRLSLTCTWAGRLGRLGRQRLRSRWPLRSRCRLREAGLWRHWSGRSAWRCWRWRSASPRATAAPRRCPKCSWRQRRPS